MSSIEPIRPEGLRVDPTRRVDRRAEQHEPRDGQPPPDREDKRRGDDENPGDGLPHVDVLV
ncbi:MAG: hypothetical protein ACKVUT_09315 [Gaiella sp.]